MDLRYEHKASYVKVVSRQSANHVLGDRAASCVHDASVYCFHIVFVPKEPSDIKSVREPPGQTLSEEDSIPDGGLEEL